MSEMKWDRMPMSRAWHRAGFGTMLLVAKLTSVWMIATASGMGGHPFWPTAMLASAALAPSAVLEFITVAHGYILARRFTGGPVIDRGVEKEVRLLSYLIYACFFANLAGLVGLGFYLDLGLAIAAPLLAPLAPLLVGSGALFVVTSALDRGVQLETQVADII